jgi:hypothetical protein
MPFTFSEADLNDFPVWANLPQATTINSHGRVDDTDPSNDALRRGLIGCESCSKTFGKRMHYKYETTSSSRGYWILTFLAVIVKLTIDHTTVHSVPKLLHYEAI